MTTTVWHRQRRHYGALNELLAREGFEVVDAHPGGRHLRLRVRRDGRETTITVAGTPAVEKHCVVHSMQRARRGTRP